MGRILDDELDDGTERGGAAAIVSVEQYSHRLRPSLFQNLSASSVNLRYHTKSQQITMKRSSSEQSSSDTEDYKPQIELPATPKKSKSTSKSTSASPEKKAKKEGQGGGQVNGIWTPEKKAEFMDVIISNGYKATNLDLLSIEVSPERMESEDLPESFD